MVSSHLVIANYFKMSIKYHQNDCNLIKKKAKNKKLSKKEKAKLEAEQAETLRVEAEKERLKKLEEDR